MMPERTTGGWPSRWMWTVSKRVLSGTDALVWIFVLD
ncbi:MAG: hypothetical protein ACI8S6_003419 [Myxococcota bacterium]|jgi:hypothetical protein